MKFQDCAAGVLAPAQIQSAIHHMARLEELSTLQPLMNDLTCADALYNS